MANRYCQLEHGMVGEHRVLVMSNPWLRVCIDIDRGAHIFEIIDRQTGINVLYQDPKGPARHDVGGWYELFPNSGPSCRFGETAMPQHGDVRDLPWYYRIEEQTESCIHVCFATESKTLPFTIEKRLLLYADRPNLYVKERITNTGTETSPYLWGQHVTFGEPFLNESCRIDLPACRVYKRPEYGNDASRLAAEASGVLRAMPGKEGELIDMAYFPAAISREMLFIEGLDDYWYNLYNEQLDFGCALSWDGSAFPCLWLWLEQGAEGNSPVHPGRRVMALEPQSSNVPSLSQACLDNQAPMLNAGESKESYLTFVLHRVRDQVASVSDAGLIRYKIQQM